MRTNRDTIVVIPGFPNYMSTKQGRIFSIKSDRFLNPYVGERGVLYVNLRKEGKSFLRRVHRLILETFVGPRPPGKLCRHLDGKTKNNQNCNLKWGTPKENQADRLTHGTSNTGTKHPHSKLIEAQVKLIFHAYHDGAYTQQYLADYFEVGRTTIQEIVEKRTWRHIWQQ